MVNPWIFTEALRLVSYCWFHFTSEETQAQRLSKLFKGKQLVDYKARLVFLTVTVCGAPRGSEILRLPGTVSYQTDVRPTCPGDRCGVSQWAWS